jgi:hypothetical protein
VEINKMKKLCISVCNIFLLCVMGGLVLDTLTLPLNAQTKVVTLAWDQDAAQNINDLKSTLIYNIAPSPRVLLGTATCTGITPNVTCPTTLNLTITLGIQYQFVAVNYDGINESADSNVVTTPGKPPKNLRR